MAETLDIDLSAARRQLQGVQDDLKGIKAEAQQVSKATNSIFAEGDAARGAVDAIKDLQREYADLKTAADTLKRALNSTYDPKAVDQYTAALADAEKGLKKYEQAAKAAGVTLEKTGQQTSTAKDVVEGLFGSFAKAALIVEAIRIVGQFTKEAFNLSRELQKTERQFAGFVGGIDNARKTIATLNKVASDLRLPTSEVQQASKALLGFGFAAGQLPGALTRIANVAKGSGKDFNELTLIYGKARASGVLFAEDINQLTEAGIPVIGQFAEQLGVSADQVKKLASEGKISFAELELAFAKLTAEGAIYNGQAVAGADASDQLAANFEKLKLSAGQGLAPAINGVVGFLNDLIVSINNLNSAEGLQQTASRFKDVLGQLLKLTPATALFKKAIDNLTTTEADRTAAEKAALTERLAAKAQAEFDALALEDAAREARNKKSKEQIDKEKKAAADAAAEIARLRIEGMAEGEAKELAQEEARFKTLVAALKKYHLDTEGAEQQHAKNVAAIKLRFYLEDLMAAKEARDAEAESIKRGFEELEKLEGDARKALLDRAKANAKVQEEAAALAAVSFEQSLLIGKRKFFEVKRSDAEIKKFEEQQAKAKELFELAQQKASLERILTFGSELSDAEKATIEARIAVIQEKIGQVSSDLGKSNGKAKPFSFLSLLGIDPNTDEGKLAAQQIQEIVGISISALNDLQAAREAEAQAAVDAADRKVDAAQEALDAELRIAELGFASNVELKQREVEQAKAQQEDALRKQAAVQKRQAQIETAQQAVSLITTAANIIKQWSSLSPIGWVLGIAQIGAMFAAFAAARAKARATVTARHGASGSVGEDGVIVGPSHEGGGVPLEVEGREFFATNGQQFGVVNRKMTDKHFDLLQAINRDDRAAMAEHLEQLTQPKFGLKTEAFGVSDSSSAPNGSSDGGNSEGAALLKKIERNTAQKEYVAGNYRIIKRGNQTRRIRLNG